MKKILLFAIVLSSTFFAACEAQSKKATPSDSKALLVSDKNIGQEVIHLDNESFKKLVFDFATLKEWKYSGRLPAIIDFYADWCGPCKMLAPHLEEIQKMYKGKLQVYKVNTDQNRELSQAFGITSLPTVVFVPMEGQPQASMGYRPLADLETEVKSVLKVIK